MGNKLPDKKLGLETNCFCGTKVICREIDYQGEKKLQWQNEDGKSHYQRNNDTGEFSCRKSNNAVAATDNLSTSVPKSNEEEISKQFERVYREGTLVCRNIAVDLCGPGASEKDLLVTIECIMKSYIQFYLAKTR